MIVCSCNVISDGQVKACVNPGPGCPRTAAQVYDCLGCSPKCGRCARTIRQIIANALMGIDVPIEVATCASDCAATCPMAKTGHHQTGHHHVHEAEHHHAHEEVHAPFVAQAEAAQVDAMSA